MNSTQLSTTNLDPDRLIKYDQSHIWHPYSTTPAAVDPIPIASANGVHLYQPDGSSLIDAMSSWWAAAHGHSHPHLVAAATRQINTMSHVMFGGITHEPAVQLAEKLVTLTDEPLSKVFFSDSGSIAVEVAIKIALQYHIGRGEPDRKRLLTWRNGYHGDTFAAMSVCDPDGGMHSMWQGTLAEQIFAPAPPPRGARPQQIQEYLDEFEHHLNHPDYGHTIAAVIIEPIVQGAGGMRFHDAALVTALRALCTRYGVLMIADEIATGFGRTGALFATNTAGVTPDILCLGKALTGGFMTLAATLTTAEIADTIAEPLMHGPTFMANPLACAVATAAMELIEQGHWRTTVPRIENELHAHLAPLIDAPGVRDVRTLGAIGVVEMHKPVDMKTATQAAIASGVWLRPFGKLIYCMPPYICTSEDVEKICAAMTAVVASERSRYP